MMKTTLNMRKNPGEAFDESLAVVREWEDDREAGWYVEAFVEDHFDQRTMIVKPDYVEAWSKDGEWDMKVTIEKIA